MARPSAAWVRAGRAEPRSPQVSSARHDGVRSRRGQPHRGQPVECWVQSCASSCWMSDGLTPSIQTLVPIVRTMRGAGVVPPPDYKRSFQQLALRCVQRVSVAERDICRRGWQYAWARDRRAGGCPGLRGVRSSPIEPQRWGLFRNARSHVGEYPVFRADADPAGE